MEERILTPQEYFEIVKGKKQHITDEDLLRVYDNCLTLINKYKITGQSVGLQKLIFHLECIEREREIVKAGIDTFIYRSDIEDYIDNIAKDTVKIIELNRYERELPDEIVNVVEKVGPLFNQMYVVFTDYTGKVERQVEKSLRSRDPILFGVFQDLVSQSVVERFYYLGDWVDEYCDLTFDKMVSEIRPVRKSSVLHKISTPQDIEELKKQLNNLEVSKDNTIRVKEASDEKRGFFERVKTYLSGGWNR